MTPRAQALPPDERRAEILKAARRLLLEHGGRVTTRQVAEAAGIAEGTLFRAFPSKRELVHAVVESLMDPTELCGDLDAISPTLPLEARVTTALARLQRSIDDISAVFAALMSMPDAEASPHGSGHHDPRARAAREEQAAALQHALERLLQPDVERLACPVPEAASLLRAMAFATAMPHLPQVTHDHRGDPARLASLLLDGLTRRGQTPELDPRGQTPDPIPCGQSPDQTQETSCSSH